jgi:hypothetical protein
VAYPRTEVLLPFGFETRAVTDFDFSPCRNKSSRPSIDLTVSWKGDDPVRSAKNFVLFVNKQLTSVTRSVVAQISRELVGLDHLALILECPSRRSMYWVEQTGK